MRYDPVCERGKDTGIKKSVGVMYVTYAIYIKKNKIKGKPPYLSLTTMPSFRSVAAASSM